MTYFPRFWVAHAIHGFTLVSNNMIITVFFCRSMNRVGEFINAEAGHELALAQAMQWEYVFEQNKGSAYDFVAKDTSKIEAKFDWDSIKTGNHYLEFAQTNDNKASCAIGLCPLGRRSGLLGRD